jgi:hypothetical protein
MNKLEQTTQRVAQRGGFRLLGVAAGVAMVVLYVAVSAPHGDAQADERLLIDTAPLATTTPHAAALDAGVDWNRVEAAPDAAPLAVAAYER